MRPTTLEEVVGQEHIIGKDKLLYRAIKADKLGSVIFYGPPGTGKPRCESDRQHDKRKIYPAECDHSRKKRYGGSGKRSATTSWNVREKDEPGLAPVADYIAIKMPVFSLRNCVGQRSVWDRDESTGGVSGYRKDIQ